MGQGGREQREFRSTVWGCAHNLKTSEIRGRVEDYPNASRRMKSGSIQHLLIGLQKAQKIKRKRILK